MFHNKFITKERKTKMKRIAFWLVALLLMSGVAMAQNGRKGERMEPKVRAERMTERMVKDLSLNDKQKKELLEVNIKWVEKMDARKEENKSNKEDENAPKKTKGERQKMMKEMKEARESYEAQLSKIFTKEQFESYQKQQAEHQQKMKDKRKNKSEE